MKRILSIFLLGICTLTYSQNLTVTPNGLANKKDNSKTFIVIEAEGKTALQLYNNALKFINKTYKNPEKVIKGDIKGEYLKFDTHVSNFLTVKNSGANITINANYTIELNFKDDRAKFEIVTIEMPAQSGGYSVLFSGGAFSGYPIYNKKGALKRPDTKTEIENYFNTVIKSISDYLQEKNSDDNW